MFKCFFHYGNLCLLGFVEIDCWSLLDVPIIGWWLDRWCMWEWMVMELGMF